MRLTPPNVITDRLRSAYDSEYYSSIYSQMNYAFGESYKDAARVATPGRMPDWPDITVRYQEIGRSRRILNAAYMSLAKNMYSAPEPTYLNVDIATNDVRKGFWKARHRLGEWGEEMSNTYLDIDQLGLGFMQAGYKTNPLTGMPQVTLRHSPLINTLWDPSERNPGRASFVAFVHYAPVEKARRIFGKEADKYVRQLRDSNSAYPVECVRFIEYFDLGYDEGEMTRALILDDIEVAPHKREKNAWGFLPMSYGVHFLAPGMKRPIGRIAMQMNTQEALNEVERHMRKILRRPSFDIADMTSLDEGDLQRVASGDTSRPVKWEGGKDGKQPFIRIPSAEVAQTILALKQHLEAQYNADSGTTDFSRGSAPVGADTLGENMLIDQRSREQSSWMERQTIAFTERTIRVVMDVAKLADRDPVLIEALSRPFVVNDPEAIEMTSIATWMAHDSDMIVDPQSLRKQDDDQDMSRELMRLEQLSPLVGVTIDPMWFTKKKLEAVKEKDINAALIGGPMANASGASTTGMAAQGQTPNGPAPDMPADDLQEHPADNYAKSYAPAVMAT